MTHDPLCPTQTMCKCKDQECWDCREVVLCQCDLIAKVRADTAQKIALQVMGKLIERSHSLLSQMGMNDSRWSEGAALMYEDARNEFVALGVVA